MWTPGSRRLNWSDGACCVPCLSDLLVQTVLEQCLARSHQCHCGWTSSVGRSFGSHEVAQASFERLGGGRWAGSSGKRHNQAVAAAPQLKLSPLLLFLPSFFPHFIIDVLLCPGRVCLFCQAAAKAHGSVSVRMWRREENAAASTIDLGCQCSLSESSSRHFERRNNGERWPMTMRTETV